MISVVDAGIPTSVDFVRSEPNHMVTAYSNKAAYVFDMETAQPIMNFEYTPDAGKCYTCYENVILHASLIICV